MNREIYLGESHDITKRREDKHTLAKELVCDTVHKLARVQTAQEVLLPLANGVEPVDSADHDLRVKLSASIPSILQEAIHLS